MKITKEQLNQIIKEEISNVFNETGAKKHFGTAAGSVVMKNEPYYPDNLGDTLGTPMDARAGKMPNVRAIYNMDCMAAIVKMEDWGRAGKTPDGRGGHEGFLKWAKFIYIIKGLNPECHKQVGPKEWAQRAKDLGIPVDGGFTQISGAGFKDPKRPWLGFASE